MPFFNVFLRTLGFLIAITVFIILLNLLFYIFPEEKENFDFVEGNKESNNIIAILDLNGPIINNFNQSLVGDLFEYITPNRVKNYLSNLKKIKQQINDVSRDYMGQNEINKVSNMLKVKSMEVQNMESRLTGGDLHLNQKVDGESENDLMSLLADERQNPEEVYENFNDKQVKKNYINDAINTLNQREKTIIRLRKFKEKSITLDELGKMLKISKERVRQIETKALEKLRKAILEISQQDKEFFI